MTISLVVLCIAVISYDVLFRRVPNWLLLVALLIHAGYLVITGEGLGGIDPWQSLLGGAIGFGLFIPLYALRVMGAGDVKFFALLGLMMGPPSLVPVWLIGSVLAGTHGLAWHLSKTQIAIASVAWNRMQEMVTRSQLYQTLLERRAGRRGIPYAAYLAVAAIMTGTG